MFCVWGSDERRASIVEVLIASGRITSQTLVISLRRFCASDAPGGYREHQLAG